MIGLHKAYGALWQFKCENERSRIPSKPLLRGEDEMAEKQCISSKSAKLRSDVYIEKVSPRTVSNCGFRMTKEQAIVLATNILAVAGASNAEGLILVTGYQKSKQVTIIRQIKAAKRKSNAAIE